VHGEVVKLPDLVGRKPAEIDGKIVVVGQTDGDYTRYLAKARAIVAEGSGFTSHAAVVGISLGIPTVIGVEGALGRLREGQQVTVDATAGTVLQGPAES
jgi:pyruvate kinase